MNDLNENYIVSPIGRLVQGDAFKPKTTNMKGQPLVDKSGKPRSEWFVALAIAKNDPGLAKFQQAIQAAAQRNWPGNEWQRPDFFWKYVDGDLPEHCRKEGFAGHQVYRMTNGFGVKTYTRGGEQQIIDPGQVKRGDYFRAAVSINGNKDATRPGIYINVGVLEFIGPGEEISAGPDAQTLFGGTPVSYTPPMPAGTPAPGMPAGTPAPGMPAGSPAPGMPAGSPAPGMPAGSPAPGMPAPGMPAGTPAPGMPAPAYDFLSPGTHNPPTGYSMTAKAGVIPYADYIKRGWTDETLIEQKYMSNEDIPF